MRRRAVAPVKIDPPHSFPTFSPREVRNHERTGRPGGGEGVGRVGWTTAGGRNGGGKGRGLAGLPTYPVCLCVSAFLNLRERTGRVLVRSYATSLARPWFRVVLGARACD